MVRTLLPICLAFGAVALAAPAPVPAPLASPAAAAPGGGRCCTFITSLPYTITQPGLYCLCSDLTGTSGFDGIIVNSSDVTIDLCGFSLVGVTGSLSGILLGSVQNVVIRDGSIRRFGNGILGLGSRQVVVEDMRLHGLTGVGIQLADDCRIEDTSVVDVVGGKGIAVFNNSMILDCLVENVDGGHAIQTQQGCTVGGTISRNNTSNGIQLGTNSLAHDSVFMNNSSAGIDSGGSSSIVRCVVSFNTEAGICGGGTNEILDCEIRGNNGPGILESSGSTIQRCTVVGNGSDGISVETNCVIADNTCWDNGVGSGGAGVRAKFEQNRIENNHCTGNDVGVAVAAVPAGTPNWVLKNSACGNAVAEYQIGANNQAGALSNAPATAGPWDNFTCP